MDRGSHAAAKQTDEASLERGMSKGLNWRARTSELPSLAAVLAHEAASDEQVKIRASRLGPNLSSADCRAPLNMMVEGRGLVLACVQLRVGDCGFR